MYPQLKLSKTRVNKSLPKPPLPHVVLVCNKSCTPEHNDLGQC